MMQRSTINIAVAANITNHSYSKYFGTYRNFLCAQLLEKKFFFYPTLYKRMINRQDVPLRTSKPAGVIKNTARVSL
jgi:hypothetical protein